MNKENFYDSLPKIREIDRKPPFEDGTFGSVYESTIAISEEGEERIVSCVMKEFKENGAAQHAFEAYEKLKLIGIKVPEMYILDEENNRIFMTNYNQEQKAAISATSSNRHIGNFSIKKILNLNELKKEIAEQCALAAKNKIRLPIDAFFFLVDKGGGDMDVDFVIGDLDLIFSKYAEELNLDESSCLRENENNAAEALKLIQERYRSFL